VDEFSSETMAKGYQAYRDSWATALSEGTLCLREVGNRVKFFIDVKTRQRSVTLKGMVNCHMHHAYAKIKTTKISSEANTKNFF